MKRTSRHFSPSIFWRRGLLPLWFGALIYTGGDVHAAYSPCPGAVCREICGYEGTSSYSGTIRLTTDVQYAKLETRARVLVDLQVQYLFWKVRYLLDELNTINNRTGRLARIDSNTRQLMNGAIKRQHWDRFQYEWLPQGERQIRAWRIQAKKEPDFAKAHPGFLAYWDVTQFGKDWQADYEAGQPVRRPDMDVPKFSDQTVSPLYLSFYAIRFLDPKNIYRFDLLLNVSDEERTMANELWANDVGHSIVWRTQFNLGDLRSPTNRPAKLVIDPQSRRLTTIHLNLASNDLGEAEATAHLKDCVLHAD